MTTEKINHRKKRLTDIGRTVPSNLKFGIIVTVAIFWSQFLRSSFDQLFSFLGVTGVLLADFLIAVIATIAGYLILLSYRKIRFRLKKIKV
jgi:hypothetical protein